MQAPRTALTGPLRPPLPVFQILPSLRASGAMLDVVDSCSMLYRLQMEGSQPSSVPSGPVPCPLPHNEGMLSRPGPRAGQGLMSEALWVSLRDLGWCALDASSAAAFQPA